MSYYRQRPVNPKHFGNRKEVLADLLGMISKSVNTGVIENATVQAERGMGKTSLLIKVLSEAPESCFTCMHTLGEDQHPKMLADALVEKMDFYYDQNLPKYKHYLGKFFQKVEEFSVLDVSIKIRKDEISPQLGLLQAVLKFKARKFGSLVLLIDEADFLSPECLAMLKSVFEEAYSLHQFPAALILSGREDVDVRLAGKYAPISRFFTGRKYALREFDSDGTKDALLKVANDLGIEWESGAISQVHQRTNGHPYFVQSYGEEALKAVGQNHRIGDAEVVAATPHVLDEAWAWYTKQWNQGPSDKEKTILRTLCKLGAKASPTNIAKVAKVKSANTLLRRLLKKGCILQDSKTSEYFLPHNLVCEAMSRL